MLVRHAATLQPYLSTKCNVSLVAVILCYKNEVNENSIGHFYHWFTTTFHIFLLLLNYGSIE